MLQKELKKAAEIIKKHGYARVISHYDADGVTSAGILCNALLRKGIQFHISITSKLNEKIIEGLDEELVIFCDMGSAHLGLILKLLKETDVIILDHHLLPTMSNTPLSSLPSSLAHVNPHCFGGVEEYGEMCASVLSYLLARLLGLKEGKKGNVDLAGLAIAGALGDKQNMDTGVNKMVLDEAKEEGVISVKKGLKIGEGKIRDLLLLSADPYIKLAGDKEKVDSFLDALHIDGESNLSDLDENKLQELRNALLSMIDDGEEAASALFGDVYTLNLEIIKNSITFMRVVDACGRLGKAGIGIGICMREEEVLEEAYSLYMKFQSKLVSELKRVRGNVKETSNIFYFYVKEKSITGILAGIMARYMYTSKPVIVINKREGKETKISARCNKKLVEAGIDLARTMEEAAKKVGGAGGGHRIASGASIPEGAEEEFIECVDRIIEESKKG
ncbi:MAG: DHHA1 domain-containing protein [Candidatus Methanospirareceae archaeon]